MEMIFADGHLSKQATSALIARHHSALPTPAASRPVAIGLTYPSMAFSVRHDISNQRTTTVTHPWS
jgi:hypothetical protein